MSMHTTRSPRPARRATRRRPMNPAPPMTRNCHRTCRSGNGVHSGGVVLVADVLEPLGAARFVIDLGHRQMDEEAIRSGAVASAGYRRE